VGRPGRANVNLPLAVSARVTFAESAGLDCLLPAEPLLLDQRLPPINLPIPWPAAHGRTLPGRRRLDGVRGDKPFGFLLLAGAFFNFSIFMPVNGTVRSETWHEE
jgi:hypothetical protein